MAAVVSILLVIAVLALLTERFNRECNSNNDCSKEQYCGSDFSCHDIPIIQKDTVKISLTLPITILSITAIILAIICRWENLFGKKGNKTKETQSKSEKQETETSDAYYSSQVQYTAK